MLRVFAGPNGSGKSTLQHRMNTGLYFVNADVIEARIRYARGFQLPVGITGDGFAAFTAASPFLSEYAESVRIYGNLVMVEDVNSYHASVIASYLRHEMILQGRDLEFETVMSSRDKVEFLQFAKDLGHVVELHYVCTNSPDINVARVAKRVSLGGHHVPEDKIRERYRRSLSLLPEALKVADHSVLWDNSAEGDSPVAVGNSHIPW